MTLNNRRPADRQAVIEWSIVAAKLALLVAEYLVFWLHVRHLLPLIFI